MNTKELIERLEVGKTGREIDAAVEEWAYADLLSKCTKVPDTSREIGYHWQHPIDGVLAAPERYSTSLDAALALVERVRPKAWIEINGPRKYLNIPVPNYWKAVVAPWEDKTEGAGWAATPAAALVAALLKAEG